MRNKNTWLMPYAGAVLLVWVALGVRYSIVGFIGDLPTWITFFPVVMFVALMAGIRAGLLATVTSIMTVYYFVLVPKGFVHKELADIVSVIFFASMGVFMSVVAGRYRRTRNNLLESNKELENEIERRKKIEASLILHQERLQNLYFNLQSVREEERANIARDIHDELGQIMTAVKLDIAWMKKQYSDHKGIFEKTSSTLSLIDGAIKSIKSAFFIFPSFLVYVLFWFLRIEMTAEISSRQKALSHT